MQSYFWIRHITEGWRGQARYDLGKGKTTFTIISEDETVYTDGIDSLFEQFEVDIIGYMEAKAEKESEK